MVTAFAALVNIMQIIDQIEHHPRPPISLDKQQVESLTKNVTFLQEFLEGYNSYVGYRKEADAMEMSIADVAHAAEDVIESHIVDQILADGEETSSVGLYEALQKVIDDMEFVKKEVMDVKEKMGVSQHQLLEDSSTSVIGSSKSASTGKNETMVGFDDILYGVLDKLKGQQSSRQIISITGMGGIGKTTLARNVYEHQLVAEHFDFLALVTISQEYKISKILLNLLGPYRGNLSQVDESELGYELHQKLSGIRYLIIMDDIWNIEVWDRLRLFLPVNNNGSRIMITTRLSNLALQIDDSPNIEMGFLDEDNSWKLFCKHVFGEEDCPPELKRIGKNIVRGCKGLPLSISVVGGLLAKSRRTQHWEHIAENLNSIVNLEENEHCLQILYMSYNSLPIHLKPCLLYMGVFDEDEKISNLLVITLWVGEGFVKPIYGKSLEEAAKEYLTELSDRNLILMIKGKLDFLWEKCGIHDLFRDLCLRECVKQKFSHNVGEQSLNIPHSMDNIRRIVIDESTSEEDALPILKSASRLVRSFVCQDIRFETSLSSFGFRLLRIAVVNETMIGLEDIIHQVNLRVIFLTVPDDQYRIPSSISHFWNLQALFIDQDQSSHLLMAPLEIWMMCQLKFIFAGRFCLPDPPSCENDMPDCSAVLKNLYALADVHNFKCSEEVVKRIPNIKILGISYMEVKGSSLANYCLNNLGCLQQLELLSIKVKVQSQIMHNLMITFPCSLKILNLYGNTSLHWDDVTTKIGPLPLLHRLKLDQGSCIGAKWETIEGHFCSLKYLKISGCSDLECWITESTHFPRLEKLVLRDLHKLIEIPSSIGDIPTLELIKVYECSDSVCDSVERIKEEQEELGNEDLQVQVRRSQRVEEEEDNSDEGTENEV